MPMERLPRENGRSFRTFRELLGDALLLLAHLFLLLLDPPLLGGDRLQVI